MKTLRSFVSVLAGTIFVLPNLAQAQLNIPSDGSDRELIVATNTVIDLSQAVTGVWSDASTNPGKGIYDPEKWAVVFKYSSVSISNGASLTFANHPSRAPVVWLVNGAVSVRGVVDLNGQNWNADRGRLTEPGPGGFRGGAAADAGVGTGSGFGPGGAFNSFGGYANARAYGSPQLVPLIGGSGGSGGTDRSRGNGGAGGGAILIAASTSVAVDGLIRANGGSGTSFGCCGDIDAFGASGGAIRIVCGQFGGSGRLEAVGGNGGDAGRIRLEASSSVSTGTANPSTAVVAPQPLLIWPPENAPKVALISVDAKPVSADPRANLGINGADLSIDSRTNTLVFQSANFPTNGTINVYIKPKNAPQTILQATLVGGDQSQATWQTRTVLPLNHTVIQARAVAP